MLWAYDEAIIKDLSGCIDPKGEANNTVRMMGEQGMMGIFAQLQEDRITFPAIYLQRSNETPLDAARYNYARLHQGVVAGFDHDTNNVYIEKALPIQLKYDLHVLTTNTADMDEIIRELLFRYSQMYYITMQIPYESKRNIRFGMAINPDTPIRRNSGVTEYVESGQLYESTLEIECQGAVLINYTPRHLTGVEIDSNICYK